MDESTLIRRVEESDAVALTSLFGQLGYPCHPETMRECISRIAQERSHWARVCVRGGTVVGCCHVFSSLILEAGLVSQVGGLVVDDRSRRAGIGRTLMASAERWAAEQGCVSMYVRSNIIREDAHAFYERIGYRRAKTQHAYRKALTCC